MKNEQMVKSVYYIAGMLEALSCLQGQTITEGTAYLLADCVDRLELIGTQLLAEDVKRHEEASTEPWNTKDPYQ